MVNTDKITKDDIIDILKRDDFNQMELFKVMEILKTKLKCKTCGEEKNRELFKKHRRECKECYNKKNREYSKINYKKKKEKQNKNHKFN